jgi:hypothetical protein
MNIVTKELSDQDTTHLFRSMSSPMSTAKHCQALPAPKRSRSERHLFDDRAANAASGQIDGLCLRPAVMRTWQG